MSQERPHEHRWEAIGERPLAERGVVRLDRCHCDRYRATLLFDAPTGDYLDVGAFLDDLDRIGFPYAATVKVNP